MKNNTEQTKTLLQRALQTLPEDFALQGVRSNIASALNQISAVENRRTKREQTIQNLADIERNKMVLTPSWQMSLPQAQAALKNLDKMIKTETDKIPDTKKKPEKTDILLN